MTYIYIFKSICSFVSNIFHRDYTKNAGNFSGNFCKKIFAIRNFPTETFYRKDVDICVIVI